MTVREIRQAFKDRNKPIPADCTSINDLTALYLKEIGPIMEEIPEGPPVETVQEPSPAPVTPVGMVFPPHDKERNLLSPEEYYNRSVKAAGDKMSVLEGKQTLAEYHADENRPAKQEPEGASADFVDLLKELLTDKGHSAEDAKQMILAENDLVVTGIMEGNSALRKIAAALELKHEAKLQPAE